MPAETEPKTEQARECIFCLIVENKEKSTKLAETSDALAIFSLEGNPLIMPKKHITKEDVDAGKETENLTHASELAWKLIPLVEKAYAVDGVNILSNLGRAAGQDVKHVHIHLLPRTPGDEIMKLGNFKRPDSELDTIAKKINSGFTSSS